MHSSQGGCARPAYDHECQHCLPKVTGWPCFVLFCCFTEKSLLKTCSVFLSWSPLLCSCKTGFEFKNLRGSKIPCAHNKNLFFCPFSSCLPLSLFSSSAIFLGVLAPPHPRSLWKHHCPPFFVDGAVVVSPLDLVPSHSPYFWSPFSSLAAGLLSQDQWEVRMGAHLSTAHCCSPVPPKTRRTSLSTATVTGL